MGLARKSSQRRRAGSKRPSSSPEGSGGESPAPTWAARQRNLKTMSRKQKRRELVKAQEFPGLNASAEAIELVPGEGILAFDNADQGEYFGGHSQKTAFAGSSYDQTRAGSSNDESGESDNEPMGSHAFSDTGNSNSPSVDEGSNAVPPWLNTDDPAELVGHKLTNEVLGLLCYMSPTPNEVALRERCITRLRRTVTHLWPGCDLVVFGSYATGMYLPEADIDVAIVGHGMRAKVKSEMYKLSYKLRSGGIASNINVISHARVPIIKYVEAGSGLNVDIAFMQTGGVETADRVCTWLRSCEALKPIAMVVRLYLKRRNLGDAAIGGLGGYATLCMVYSRLEQISGTHGSGGVDLLKNAGLLLLDFFDYYGHRFDNQTQFIRPVEAPHCYPRHRRENGSMTHALAIEDPCDSQNNISKATHNYSVIKRSFGNAADMLKGLCLDWQRASPRRRAQMSFLGPLLRYAGNEARRQKNSLQEALRVGRQGPSPAQMRDNTGQHSRGPHSRGPHSRAEPNRNDDIFPKIAARNNRPRRRGSHDSQGLPQDSVDGRAGPGNGRHFSDNRMDGFSNGSRSSRSNSGARGAGDRAASSGKPAQSREAQPKRRRSSGDDSDSRTRSTTEQRRQFWSRKAGPVEAKETPE